MVSHRRALLTLLVVLPLGQPLLRGSDAHAEPGVDASGRSYEQLEEAVLAEMNLLRRDPRAYAAKLLALRPSYRGNRILRGPDEPAIATVEGVSALDEAVRALRRAPRRLPRLGLSVGLTQAARGHARDLGLNGGLGHQGSDGSSPDQRVSRHGVWDGIVAENISFGPNDAEEIVIGLLVDDDVPDRGHREVLLTRELFFAGVACGPHPTYRVVCVMDYATSFRAKRRLDLERTPRRPPAAPGPLDHRSF